MADDTTRIANLESGLSDVKLQLSRVEGEVRIVKHDYGNMKMGFDGFVVRSEKFQDGVTRDIRGMATDFRAGFDSLKDDIAKINVKQEKGFSFFAGIAFMLSLPIAAIVAAVRLLGGH